MAGVKRLVEDVKEARAEFEARLDDLDVAKERYYDSVRRLYKAGMPLREIADAIGISHQRVHQIVGEEPPVGRVRGAVAKRARAGGVGLLLILFAGWWGATSAPVQPRADARRTSERHGGSWSLGCPRRPVGSSCPSWTRCWNNLIGESPKRCRRRCRSLMKRRLQESSDCEGAPMETAHRLGPAALESDTGAAPVAVRGLTKRFGDVVAVDDLTFEIRARRVTGFLGQNGAGKSTTMRIVLGLVHPTSGTATVRGVPYRALPNPPATVGAVLETHGFNPLRTGRNHLRVTAAACCIDDSRVDEMLDVVDLSRAANRKAGTYSLGMRQRLGLATALLADPSILILDEPTNGLDPGGIRWLREFMRSFVRTGKSVLVSSHQLGEIETMADDVVMIHRGRLVVNAPVKQLMSGVSAVVVEASDPARLGRALTAQGLEVDRAGSGRLVVRGGDERRVGEVALQAGVALIVLTRERTSLEKIFFDITGEEAIR